MTRRWSGPFNGWGGFHPLPNTALNLNYRPQYNLVAYLIHRLDDVDKSRDYIYIFIIDTIPFTRISYLSILITRQSYLLSPYNANLLSLPDPAADGRHNWKCTESRTNNSIFRPENLINQFPCGSFRGKEWRLDFGWTWTYLYPDPVFEKWELWVMKQSVTLRWSFQIEHSSDLLPHQVKPDLTDWIEEGFPLIIPVFHSMQMCFLCQGILIMQSDFHNSTALTPRLLSISPTVDWPTRHPQLPQFPYNSSHPSPPLLPSSIEPALFSACAFLYLLQALPPFPKQLLIPLLKTLPSPYRKWVLLKSNLFLVLLQMVDLPSIPARRWLAMDSRTWWHWPYLQMHPSRTQPRLGLVLGQPETPSQWCPIAVWTNHLPSCAQGRASSMACKVYGTMESNCYKPPRRYAINTNPNPNPTPKVPIQILTLQTILSQGPSVPRKRKPRYATLSRAGNTFAAGGIQLTMVSPSETVGIVSHVFIIIFFSLLLFATDWTTLDLYLLPFTDSMVLRPGLCSDPDKWWCCLIHDWEYVSLIRLRIGGPHFSDERANAPETRPATASYVFNLCQRSLLTGSPVINKPFISGGGHDSFQKKGRRAGEGGWLDCWETWLFMLGISLYFPSIWWWGPLPPSTARWAMDWYHKWTTYLRLIKA